MECTSESNSRQISGGREWLFMGAAILALASVAVPAVCKRLGNPAAVFDETEMEFGMFTRAAAPIAQDLWVRNDGIGDLQIDVAGTTCGCARVIAIDQIIEPGQRGRIRVEVSPAKSIDGLNNQELFLRTNDPSASQMKVRLRWSVREDKAIRVGPEQLDVRVTREELRLVRGAASQQVVMIGRSRDGPIPITDVQTSPGVSVRTTPITYKCPTCVGPGLQAVRLGIILKANLAEGPFDEWVRVRTTHPECPEIFIPIRGEVISELYAEPSRLVMEDSTTGAGKSVTLTIRRRDGQALDEPQRVTPSDPSIRVVSIRSVSGAVDVTLAAPAEAPATDRGGPSSSQSAVTVSWPLHDMTVPIIRYSGT